MSNPADFGTMFGGDKPIYPPAPAGYKYVNLDMPIAPPGYDVKRMSSIANNSSGPGANAGGTRQRYQFGAHTPEGIRERYNEQNRLHDELLKLRQGSPGYSGRGQFRTPQSVPGGVSESNTPSTQLPSIKKLMGEGGGPTVQDLISQSLSMRGAIEPPAPVTQAQKLKAQARQQALGNFVDKKSGTLGQDSGEVTPGSRVSGYNIEDWRSTPGTREGMIDLRQPEPPAATPPTGPLPGLPTSTAPPSDTTQSSMDARDVPMPRERPELSMYRAPLPRQDPRTMGAGADEMWKWAEGIAKNAPPPSGGSSMVPQVLRDIWTNMTAPTGPAFNVDDLDLNEQRYNPLPNPGAQ